MIGEHGEVYLVDWGIAIKKENNDSVKNKMAGTPIYMSPEQARKEAATELSDIYCLGTSLYHSLFNLMPATFNDTETFWRHKTNGIIPALPKQHDIPSDLVAICLKCIKAKPQERYQSMDAVIADLKLFQFGKMVSAYQYSLLEGIKFHLKSSSKHVAWFFTLLVLGIVFALQIYQYYTLESSGWGSPIYEETFTKDHAWEKDWEIYSKNGSIRIHDKKLLTQDSHEFTWFYKQPLSGGAAIEFEGSIPKNSNLGDLSIVYSPDIYDLNYRGVPKTTYYLQHGAVDNSCSIITGPDGWLDYNPIHLKHDTKYHIRGEIDGDKLRLYLNDELICSYNLLFPVNKGYIGLYSYYHGKTFDNIRIYNKELPQLTSIIATGDLLYNQGQYDLALQRFDKISASHAGSSIGEESLYKAGLCHLQLGDTHAAIQTWAAIQSPRYTNQIDHYKWQQLYNDGELDTLLSAIQDAYTTSIDTAQIKHEWASYLKQATVDGKHKFVDQLLQLRELSFPNDQIYSQYVFEALKLKGQTNRALVLFPEQDHIAIQALLESGRYKDIIRNYPLQKTAVLVARYRSGQYSYLIQHHSERKDILLKALIANGQLEEALVEFAHNPNAISTVINDGYGDPDTAIAKNPENEYLPLTKLYRNGQYEEFLRLSETTQLANPGSRFDARIAQILTSLPNPRAISKIQRLIQHAPGSLHSQQAHMFSIYFLPAVLEHLNGNPQTLKQQQEYIQVQLQNLSGKRAWYCSRLLDGKINQKKFMDQPSQLAIEHDYLLYTGIRHDLKKRKKLALQYYQSALDLPMYKKKFSAAVHEFLAYRIRELSQ